MPQAVVFITGRDPSTGFGGGSTYVRAHARAALCASFEPHIFCLGEREGLVVTDFGVVHRVKTPFRPRGLLNAAPGQHPDRFLAHWLSSVLFDARTAILHMPVVARHIEHFLLSRPGPHLLHGFFTWGAVGLQVQRRLAPRRIRTVVVNSFYTMAKHEAQAKYRGMGASTSLVQRLLFTAEYWWTGRVVNRHERHVFTQVQLALLNYDSVRRLLLAEHGAGPKIHKLPYSPETAFPSGPVKQASTTPEPIAPLQPADAPLIVSVSRHDPRKGVDVLLHALAHLRAAGLLFRACLVSGGPLLSAHRALAASLGLTDSVALTDWVADSRIYLKHADIFVLPSRQEGSGSLSLLEALQAGVPIVASDVDGIPEDVTHEESALLVEPGNVTALGHALGRALIDQELRQRLARRGRQTFDERFSARAFVLALGATYAELGFEPAGSPAR